MAGARALKIIVTLLGFLLTDAHRTFAQSSSVWDTVDANALTDVEKLR